MGRQSFIIGTEFLYNDRNMKLLDISGTGLYIVQDVKYRTIYNWTKEDFEKRWLEGITLPYAGGTVERESFSTIDVTNVNDQQQRDLTDAKERLAYIQPLLSIPKNGRSKAFAQRAKETGCSKSSLYEWCKSYLESNRDIRSLMTNRHRCGGPNKSRLPEEVERIMETRIKENYLKKVRSTATSVLKLIRNDINIRNQGRSPETWFPIPSLDTVSRRINQIDVLKKAKAMYGTAYVQSTVGYAGDVEEVTAPLEVVQCDSTTFPVFVVHDKYRNISARPTVTAMIDVYTRYPIGINIDFNKEGYQSVMLTLFNGIYPKTRINEQYGVKYKCIGYGVPKVLLVDNGKAYKNRHLEHACLQIGTSLEYCEPKHPWTKGIVERFLRTMQTEFGHLLPGGTFENSVELKKRDLNAQEQAVIGFNAFVGMFYKWLYDDYSIDFHEGIQDIPRERWERNMVGIPPMPQGSMEDNRILLLPLGEERCTNKGVLHWEKLKYQSPELHRLSNNLNGDPLTWKYDPKDLGKIYVLDSVFTKRYIEVPCSQKDYASGLSLYVHKQICKETRKKYNRVDRDTQAQVMAERQKVIDDESVKTKTFKRKLGKSKSSKQTKQHHFQQLGSNRESNETEMLKKKVEANKSSMESLRQKYRDPSNWSSGYTK